MLRYLGLALLSLTAVLGCGDGPAPAKKTLTSADVKKDTQEVVDTAAKQRAQQREEYLTKLKGKLDELDTEINTWQKKAENAGVEARKGMEENLKKLREQREKAGTQLKQVGDASAASWDQVRVGMDNAWDDLSKAFDKARKEFNK